MSITWVDRGGRSDFHGLDERDHELRSALFGIEASAHGLSRYRDALTQLQVDELARALAGEVRRLRTLLQGGAAASAAFDLAEAIGPGLAAARAGGQEVRSSVAPGIGITGCRDSAAQVVVSLLDEARRHAPGSPVELRASQLCGSVTLYVEDRGPGICPSMLDRVFERGVCGEDSSGSGLGLFIARRRMTEMGGSIAAHRRLGGGASFVLRFRCSADS
jgi:signal transduction histidine kinase